MLKNRKRSEDTIQDECKSKARANTSKNGDK